MEVCVPNAVIASHTLAIAGAPAEKRRFATEPIILFFKARAPVRDADTLDMFGGDPAPEPRAALVESVVPVRGHVTSKGVYVVPHTAIRKKKMSIGSPQFDLFAPQDVGQTEVSGPAETPPTVEPEMVGQPPSAKKTKEKIAKPKVSEEKATPATTFGVPANVTKAQRKRFNARALAILQKRDEDITDAEKHELSLYSGQGGVGDSLNEYYTRPDVASAIWDILGRLGVSGGEVLEPSLGTGVFAATAPSGVKVVGVELDPTSARISRLLHGARHEINESACEAFAGQDPRQFDAVVGNPPFGLRGALIAQDKRDFAEAERYFLDTAIDKTKPGGVIAMVVPSGILSSSSGAWFRELMLRKAEFLGAHRLPNTAFSHTHTGVVTDIVVLRKRDQDVANALSSPSQRRDDGLMRRLGLWDDEVISGRYFETRGAKNIHGSPEDGWRSKANIGNDFTVTGSMDGVAQAIGQSAFDDGHKVTMADVLDQAPPEDHASLVRAAGKPPYDIYRVGDTKVVDGVAYVLTGEPPRWHRAQEEEKEHPSLAEARELGARIERVTPDTTDRERKQILSALDDFIDERGNPHDIRPLVAASRSDPGLLRVLSAVSKDGAYSDAITGTTYRRGDSIDAVVLRLVRDHDTFTARDVARFTGLSSEEVTDRLFASNAYRLISDGRIWTTKDRYFTGNLWERYDAVQQAIDGGGLSLDVANRLREQAKEILDRIDPKSLEDIEFSMASGWVPTQVLETYLNSRLNDLIATSPTSAYYLSLDKPLVTFENNVYTITGGVPNEKKLLEQWLNRSGLRKADGPAVDAIDDEFRDFCKGNQDVRQLLEDAYNRLYRGTVEPEYSNDAIDVPGLDPAISINPYHWGNLRWAIDKGRGIIAADVGLGKTVEGLSLARLLKANGMAKKPMIVVPKSVLRNWVAEIENFFPGSRVLVIGETNGKADTEAQRNAKWHELAQSQSYDFVLSSMTAFDDLDLDPITKHVINEEDFWVKRGKQYDLAGDKRQKQIREAWMQAQAKGDVSQRTKAIYFNQLGVDSLIMDEFHAMKNLFDARARFGDQPKFLGGSGRSQRAQDFGLKASWLLQNHHNRGVFGLTATPTKNSPLEIYSMLSHVAPDMWQTLGLRNSEEFLDRYAMFEPGLYLGVDGTMKEGTLTKGFKNMLELRELMQRFIRRQTAAEVGLKIPEKRDEQHFIDMDDEQRKVYGQLRAELEDADSDSTGSGHIFSIMDRMRKAAIDLELYDPGEYKGHVSPKLREAASTIAKNSADGGQVVFCDSNAVHEKLARLLVGKGIPREKIGIINGDVAKSAEARQRIAEAFNAGKLRVVIGNTGVMGEGLNLQKDTTDLHNLDLPWEPASLQQRTGRAVRQKNVHDSVRVHHYLAKGTFDGYRLQTVGAKKDWQDQVWHGGDRLENLEAQGQLSREELQIMMSADPDAARAAIEKDVWAKKAAYEAQQRANANEVFIKFQELKSNYHALKDKGTQSGLRLKQRRDQLRAQLNASQYFDAKEALDDSKGPAALHPVTGEVYRANDGIEIPGGLHGEVYFSDKPTKWVIKGVDAIKGVLFLRPYGDSTQGTESLSLGKIPDKVVKKFAYDAKDENLELIRSGMGAVLRRAIFSAHRSPDHPEANEATAVQSILDAAMSAIDKEGLWHGSESGKDRMKEEISNALGRYSEVLKGRSGPDANNYLSDLTGDIFSSAYLTATGIGANVHGLQDLVGKDDTLLERHAEELQYVIKRNVRRYLDGWKGDFVPVINRANGKPALVKGYDARKVIDSNDLLLPTEANKILAVEAWKQAERQKNWRKEGEYVRGRFVDRGMRPNYLGMYNQYTNPWSGVITSLWGAEAVKVAEDGLNHEIARAVRSAGSIFEAQELADQARRYSFGGKNQTSVFPREVLEARMEQAMRLKDSDEALEVASLAHKLGHTDLAINTIEKVDKAPRDILGRLGDMGSFVGGGHDRYGIYSNAEWKYDPRVLQAIREHVEKHRLHDEPTPGVIIRKNWGDYLSAVGA